MPTVAFGRPVSPDAYTALTDESGIGEQYLLYGGVFLPSSHVEAAEAKLEDFCRARGFTDREMSWKKCSASKVERYCAFGELLWSLNDAYPPVDFRAMVVNTHLTPLRSEKFDCPTEEVGFYKFYYQFITRSLRIVAVGSTQFEIIVASLPDQYPYRTEVLRATVSGRLKQQFGDDTTVTEVTRGDPRQRRLHQLADVLLGAVSYAYNRSHRQSEKARICATLEARAGQPLDIDFRPEERPFNVWPFGPKGTRRWASGSQGVV